MSKSQKKLLNTKIIVTVALLIASQVVLDFFTIQFSSFLHMTFEFLITGITGFLYGPIVAAIGAVLSDTISFVINPKGPYFFGYTLSAMLSGVTMGLFLYKRQISVIRSAITRTTQVLLLNLALNTFWSSVLYSVDFWAVLPARAAKNAILLPVEIILLFVVLRTVDRLNLK